MRAGGHGPSGPPHPPRRRARAPTPAGHTPILLPALPLRGGRRRAGSESPRSNNPRARREGPGRHKPPGTPPSARAAHIAQPSPKAHQAGGPKSWPPQSKPSAPPGRPFACYTTHGTRFISQGGAVERRSCSRARAQQGESGGHGREKEGGRGKENSQCSETLRIGRGNTNSGDTTTERGLLTLRTHRTTTGERAAGVGAMKQAGGER